MHRTFLVALAAGLAACGGEGVPPPRVSPRVAVADRADGALPDVACRYESEAIPTRGGVATRAEWLFWRVGDVVETRESLGESGEVWWKDASGRLVGHEKVFHRERRVIEYAPGDLAALGVDRTWQRAATVIDERVLGTELGPAGREDADGRVLRIYRGRAGGVDTEVAWLESLAIPARVRQARLDCVVELRLVEAVAPDDATWPRAARDGYARIDFADVGDRPGDAFLRRFHAGMHGDHDH